MRIIGRRRGAIVVGRPTVTLWERKLSEQNETTRVTGWTTHLSQHERDSESDGLNRLACRGAWEASCLMAPGEYAVGGADTNIASDSEFPVRGTGERELGSMGTKVNRIFDGRGFFVMGQIIYSSPVT